MIDTVLFDLDGTIIDTNELIIASFLETLQGHTPKPLTREFIVAHMGKPLKEQIRLFTGRELVDDLEQAYRAFNFANHDKLVKEFPHVEEVISRLHAEGFKLGVVTTKIRRTTQRGLLYMDLERYFHAVVTIEDVSRPKPDPEPVRKALQELNAKPEHALMVGDSPADIESANRAGAQSVAVGWSLKGVDALLPYHPRHVIHDIRELLEITGIMEKKR